MQQLSLICLALLIHGSVDALSLQKRDVPAVFHMDISRGQVIDPVTRDRVRRKRNKSISQSLDNEETLYFCNVTLGTPAQTLRLTLDTGSSDLWCNAANSTLCSGHLMNPCGTSGTYDANSSSTYQFLSSDFSITYADGSTASGDYVTDVLSIGGASLKSFQFGVGYTSTSLEGVLGIGYTTNEAQIAANGRSYANLPQAMVDDGLINTVAYSLWLNDLDANTGSILFGGVNSDKYTGELETLPIQSVNGGFSQFIIALTGLSLSNSSVSKSYSSSALPVGVLLDSGSSLTYLPDSVVQSLYTDLGVTYDSSSGTAYVPCSLMNQNTNLNFTFSSPSIPVSLSELVLQTGSGATFPDGTPACIFGIVPAGTSTAVLGDTFLRSAYVVYDLASNQISLAKTNFNSTTDNILEIGTGSATVPGATAVSNPVTSVVVGGGGARIGGPTGTGLVISTSTGAAHAMVPTGEASYLAHGVTGLLFLLAL